MSRFRAISLFSNCGAGDIGYRRAGFEFDVMAELDPRRLKVSLENHPGAVGVEGDLRKTWKNVVKEYERRAGKSRRPALLCACPPCQGMSSANSDRGKQEDADAGSRDDRNLLVTVIVKVAKRLKPSLIVVENVPAFLTRKVLHPKDDKPVSGANFLIASLAPDYEAFPLYADLCEFGIPQSRTRAFLTLVRRDIAGLKMLNRLGRAPYPRPTHPLDGGGEKPITLSAALESFRLPELDASNKESAVASGFGDFHRVPVWDERTYAMVAAIPANSGSSAWKNKKCVHCGIVDVASHDAKCPKCGDPLLRPVVQAKNGRYRLIRGFESSYRRMHGDRPSATITTASGHIGSDYTIHPTQNRLMSVLECALLQTFPADFAWGDALKEWGHTRVREMIGEAVPPAFTEQHGQVLMSVLREKWSRAPISCSDQRVTEPWRKLAKASRGDSRPDPRKLASYLLVKEKSKKLGQKRRRLSVRTSLLFEKSGQART